MPSSRTKRKPKHSAATAVGILPDPFACSAIVHGERVYVAQDMRHDEAQAYADHIGAHAVEGGWLSDADLTLIVKLIEHKADGKELAAKIVKAQTKLEGIQ